MQTYTIEGEDRPDGWSVIEPHPKDRLRFRVQFFELMLRAGREEEALEALREIYRLIEELPS